MQHVKKNRRLGETMSAQEIRDLRYRLAADPKKPVSQQQFSELLGLSWSTVARWERGGHPDRHLARKLSRLSDALNVLGEMVKRDYRLAFLQQHHPLLLNLRPIDLLDTEEGAMAVIRLLEGAETGAFA